MQSDLYGDVADLTRAVRMVTPAGMMATRPVPSTSTGPSVREMVLGSEGRLGIITEATVHVHHRRSGARSSATCSRAGPRASQMRDIAAGEAAPSVTRVSDAYETAFSFSTKQADSPLDRLKSKALSTYLTRRRNFDLEAMCLSFIGYEGTKATSPLSASWWKRSSAATAAWACTSPGAVRPEEVRHPYIRDYLLDRGALADVSETSAPWSALPGLYDNVMAAARGASPTSACPATSCATSRTLPRRGALYFIRVQASPAREPLEEYDAIKSAIQQTFIDSGATLSHHHAVGTEHARWLEEDISAPGVEMVRTLLEGMDPGANLNPGKIVSANRPRGIASAGEELMTANSRSKQEKLSRKDFDRSCSASSASS